MYSCHNDTIMRFHNDTILSFHNDTTMTLRKNQIKITGKRYLETGILWSCVLFIFNRSHPANYLIPYFHDKLSLSWNRIHFRFLFRRRFTPWLQTLRKRPPSAICSPSICLVCLIDLMARTVALLPDETAPSHRCPNEMSVLNHVEVFIVKSWAEYISHKANRAAYLH